MHDLQKELRSVKSLSSFLISGKLATKAVSCSGFGNAVSLLDFSFKNPASSDLASRFFESFQPHFFSLPAKTYISLSLIHLVHQTGIQLSDQFSIRQRDMITKMWDNMFTPTLLREASEFTGTGFSGCTHLAVGGRLSPWG